MDQESSVLNYLRGLSHVYKENQTWKYRSSSWAIRGKPTSVGHWLIHKPGRSLHVSWTDQASPCAEWSNSWKLSLIYKALISFDASSSSSSYILLIVALVRGAFVGLIPLVFFSSCSLLYIDNFKRDLLLINIDFRVDV